MGSGLRLRYKTKIYRKNERDDRREAITPTLFVRITTSVTTFGIAAAVTRAAVGGYAVVRTTVTPAQKELALRNGLESPSDVWLALFSPFDIYG